jgi:tetrahydromethanopterin S-methyltransferase subunit G
MMLQAYIRMNDIYKNYIDSLDNISCKVINYMCEISQKIGNKYGHQKRKGFTHQKR